MKKILKKLSKTGLALTLAAGGMMSYYNVPILAEEIQQPTMYGTDVQISNLKFTDGTISFDYVSQNPAVVRFDIYFYAKKSTESSESDGSSTIAWAKANTGKYSSDTSQGVTILKDEITSTYSVSIDLKNLRPYSGSGSFTTEKLTSPNDKLWMNVVPCKEIASSGDAASLKYLGTFSSWEYAAADTNAANAANAWKTKHSEILAVKVGEVTKDHLTAITKALADYDALTPATAKDLLKTEKAKLDSMKAAVDAETATEFIKNYLTVDSAVITKVTSTNYQKVIAAENPYNDLSDAAKAVVKERLTAGGKDYPGLLEDAKAINAANAWKTTHSEILAVEVGAVSKDHLDAITKALADYDALKPTTAKDLLKTEKAKLDSMKAAAEADETATGWINKNKGFLEKPLKDVTKDDLTNIDKLIKELDEFPENVKAKLTEEKAKLDSMKEAAEDDKTADEKATGWISKNKGLLEKLLKDVTKDDLTKIDELLDELETFPENVKAKLTEEKNTLTKMKEKIELDEAKATAKAAIVSEVEKKKAAIDALTSLTADEVTDAKAAIDEAAGVANTAIDKAEDIAATETAVTAMKATTDEIITTYTLTNAKNKLKNEIKEIADKKIKAINDLSDLTADEKKVYTDKIEDTLKKTNEAIDLEKTDDKFTSMKTDFEKAIQIPYKDAEFLNLQKSVMKEFKATADEKIAAINKMNLSDKEKEDLIGSINASVEAVNKIVEEAKTEAEITTELKVQLALLDTFEDEATANAFTNTYLREKAGTALYQKVDSTNVDQIISGTEDFDALRDEQKALVNKIIAEESDFENYDDYLTKADKYVTESASKFIAQHLTKEDKSIVKSATHDTYELILGGADDWSKLSKTEKAVIEASLKELGASETYENMLKEARKGTSLNASQFIQKYLTKDNKNYYSSATKENYKQIMSGEETWNKLNPSEQAKINESLKALGINKDYETLLKEAKAMKAKVDAEAKENAKKKPSTGDTTSMALWMSLLGISGGALVAADRKRRKMK